jgi:hypothetical protein
MKFFAERSHEPDPFVIKGSLRSNVDYFYSAKQITGEFVRVIPSTWREVSFLQSLEKGYNLFAPWHGDGVLVRADFLPPVNDRRRR